MAENQFGARQFRDSLRTPSGGGAPRGGNSQEGGPIWVYVLAAVLAGGAGMAAAAFGGDVRSSLMAAMSGPPQVEYRSRVATACDKGWADERYNRDQIHCWMTNDRERLCDPRERQALVDRIKDYQNAADRWEGAMNRLAFGVAANPTVVSVGVSEARSRDPNLSESDRAEHFANTMDMAQGVMAPANQLLERDSSNETKRSTVREDVRDLLTQGYISGDDFSWPVPEIIKTNLDAARPNAPPHCRKASGT